jgi:hypothetical protein
MDITRIGWRLEQLLTPREFDKFRELVDLVGPSTYVVRPDGSAIDFVRISDGERRTWAAPASAHADLDTVSRIIVSERIGEWARFRYKLAWRGPEREAFKHDSTNSPHNSPRELQAKPESAGLP